MGTARPLLAQELEPRAYAASPVGVNFLLVSATRSSGGVVVDPSLLVENASATVAAATIGVGRTFSLFGRTALAAAAVPYAWADASGDVGEQQRQATRSGLADPRAKLSVNLIGGRALAPREFARGVPRTILGVSLTVAPPIGQYWPEKLINLGANRWSFKPEVGLSHGSGHWTIEGYAGVWMFTANDRYYPGTVLRSQQPITTLQGHASYTFRPQFWAAFDATFYAGGTTTVDGVKKADLQRNSRIGTTVSLPLVRQQSLKITANTGATTRIGADFKTIGVAWQLTWLD